MRIGSIFSAVPAGYAKQLLEAGGDSQKDADHRQPDPGVKMPVCPGPAEVSDRDRHAEEDAHVADTCGLLPGPRLLLGVLVKVDDRLRGLGTTCVRCVALLPQPARLINGGRGAPGRLARLSRTQPPLTSLPPL